tara:strand:- start:503 stop:739 length:237 start_codon:yes stop_codon:yes gene_type:complete
MKGKITMKKSKNKKLTLTLKNKKLIDKFIKMISDMNKKQNKTVTSYYSFKETLTDYLKVILSEQWNGELKKQIEKAGS